MKTTSSISSRLNKFGASLNFAFCPVSALKSSKASRESMMQTEEISLMIMELPESGIDILMDSFRYFYICYSIKVEDIEEENKDYFYFQLFSQIGDQQTAIDPVYGFYTEEQILSMIKDINGMFDPEIHERQIFESYVQEMNGSADDILKLMQDWTQLKILQFNDLYFQDEEAVSSLYALLEEANSCEKSHKKRAIRKPRTVKNKKYLPTEKKKKNKKPTKE